MTRRSSWAKSWAYTWKNTWGKVSEEEAAAGGVKKRRRRPFRTGAPWHWMPPPAPLRRTRRHRDAELVALLHP